MKRTSLTLALIIVAAACASSTQSDAPPVEIALVETGTPGLFYFAGPINVQYQLAVNNPTDRQITLRRLDLSTQGPGAYSLRTSGVINLKVPAHSTATTSISAWGRSRGGYLMADEPVSMRGTAIFDDGSGKSFSKIFLQRIVPQ